MQLTNIQSTCFAPVEEQLPAGLCQKSKANSPSALDAQSTKAKSVIKNPIIDKSCIGTTN